VSHRDDDHGRQSGPSQALWPAGFAAGVVVFLVGLVAESWIVFSIGVAIAVLFGFMWAYGGARVLRRVEELVGEEPEPEPEPAPVAEAPPRISRGQFLTGATIGVSGLIGAAVTVPIVGFAVAPAFVGQGEDEIDLGPVTNFPQGSWVVANFNYRNPREPRYEGERAIDDAASVNRRTAYIRFNGFAAEVPSFTILSNRCVHLGCPVQPGGLILTDNAVDVDTPNGVVVLTPAQPNNFSCPCHGGSYDLEGNKTAGPPVRALDRYRYAIKEGNLVLADRFSVSEVEGEGADARMKAFRVYPPGDHVDGPDEWMYPFVS
jgi:menaquinol-cytochrome c reductase iron-sulfur subunit